MTDNIIIFNEYETMLEIYNNKYSICRFGDGEIYHLFQTKSKYKSGGQICSKIFQNKLEKVLTNTNKNILIGFSGHFSNKEFCDLNYKNQILSECSIKFFNEYKLKLKNKYPFLFLKKIYSAEITRLSQLNNYLPIIEIFDKMFSENNCVFIGNIKNINIIKSKFINKFKNIEFIEGPNLNAFNNYDDILNKINNIDEIKTKLILISLGPTSTILCYDLALQGNWTIDTGHYFDMLSKIS